MRVTKPFSIAISCFFLAGASFGGESITFDDGNAVPNAGSYTPGQLFSFDVTIAATDFDSVGAFGLFLTTSASAVGYFRITTDVFPMSSPFTERSGMLPAEGELVSTGGGTNLGGSQPVPDGWLGPPGVPSNTSYFVATISIRIDSTALPGTYSLSGTGYIFSGIGIPSGPGEISPILHPEYVVTIVPEPMILNLLATGALLSWFVNFLYRNRKTTNHRV